MGRRWRHISTLKESDKDGLQDLLVWNSCNGPHYISYLSDEWFNIFWQTDDGWTMWQPVIGPTDEEKILAAKIAKRLFRRPIIEPSCGCIFCDLDLAPTNISGVPVHETKRGNRYCSKSP